MEYHVELPFTEESIEKLKSGDILYLNGEMYTARDAAHKRMYDAICEYEKQYGSSTAKELAEKNILPLDISDVTFYYLGPTPARPGQVIGSAGPTTSGRMDKYTPKLLDLGVKGMIGKGRRSEEVRASIAANKAIYMGATGGAGALLSKCIKSAEVIAYEDLGTEAIRKLYVKDFPVTVLIDAAGEVYVQ